MHPIRHFPSQRFFIVGTPGMLKVVANPKQADFVTVCRNNLDANFI
jgi:hypothetical protein